MIVTIFGKPGAGKSTIASFFCTLNNRKRTKYYRKAEKSKIYKFIQEHDGKWYSNLLHSLFWKKNFYDVIYSTDETIQFTVPIKYDELGMWKPTWNSCFLLEEAGIGLNNRDYKKLSLYSKRLAAMHRHSGADILILSQTVDIDKAYRQRSQLMFLASKFGPWTFLRRITYGVDVDENTHDLVDAYAKLPLLLYFFELLFCQSKKNKYGSFPFQTSRFIYRPAWYKYFDSFVDDFDYPMIAPDVQMKLDEEEAKRKEEARKLTEKAKFAEFEEEYMKLHKMA